MLVAGTRKRSDLIDHEPRNASNANTSTAAAAGSFPVGSYTITTYLSTVTSNCTSNPATWLCYPYRTYTDSATLSAATFSWIISATSTTSSSAAVNSNAPPSYTISSTINPFSLVFSSTPLILKDDNQATEHFSFVLTAMNKPVVPVVALASNNAATTCYFNQTTLEARLYTKMAKTYPASLAGSNGNSSTASEFAPWPYAASIEQTASGGNDVPNCYDAAGKKVGDFKAQMGGECSCAYQNYGT